jgi:hypothetical protein
MYRTLDIYKIREINLENLIYSDIQGKNNRKCSFIKYGNNRLLFQTCELYNVNKATKKDDYFELDIPLYGKSISKTEDIIKFFKDLDKRNILQGNEKKSSWFNDNEDIKYKSIIRLSENIDSEIFANGFIKIKIVPHSTKIVYNNKIITPDKIKEDTYIRLILECYALWITDNGYGLYMKPIMIEQTDIIHENIEFRPDSPDDNIYNDILDTVFLSENVPKKKEIESKNESHINVPHIDIPHTDVSHTDITHIDVPHMEVSNNCADVLESHIEEENNVKKYLDEYSNNTTVTDNYLRGLVSDSNNSESINDLSIEIN